MKNLYEHLKGMIHTEESYINISAFNTDTMKSFLLLCALASLILMTSCGRVETPEEFFDITGIQGKSGEIGDNGSDGEFNGSVEYREVCRDDNDGVEIETLLYLDGKYMAFLQYGSNSRLIVLEEEKTYRTTDDRYKRFKIINGDIVCL